MRGRMRQKSSLYPRASGGLQPIRDPSSGADVMGDLLQVLLHPSGFGPFACFADQPSQQLRRGLVQERAQVRPIAGGRLSREQRVDEFVLGKRDLIACISRGARHADEIRAAGFRDWLHGEIESQRFEDRKDLPHAQIREQAILQLVQRSAGQPRRSCQLGLRQSAFAPRPPNLVAKLLKPHRRPRNVLYVEHYSLTNHFFKPVNNSTRRIRKPENPNNHLKLDLNKSTIGLCRFRRMQSQPARAPAMRTIEVDFDVYKALTMRRP